MKYNLYILHICLDYILYYADNNTMELVDKKEHIIRGIKTGLDLYSSMIIATCTSHEIKELEDNEEFKGEVLFAQKYLEQALLEAHTAASNISQTKGGTHGVEWMLEKLNPERFGKSTKVTLPPGGGASIYLPEKE